MNIIWTYILLGTCGIIFQTCIKIKGLIDLSKTSNHIFSFKEYIKSDWITILSSMITVGIAIMTLDEWLPLNAMISSHIKIFFVFLGYTGSSIIQFAFSFYNRKLMAIIDIKTNIADKISPAIDAGNLEGVEPIEKDKAKLSTTK